MRQGLPLLAGDGTGYSGDDHRTCGLFIVAMMVLESRSSEYLERSLSDATQTCEVREAFYKASSDN